LRAVSGLAFGKLREGTFVGGLMAGWI
jgi:hypothetical protein